jgi:cytoskeletal protein RodZ
MNRKTRLLYRAILEQSEEKKQAEAAKDQAPFRLRRKKESAPTNEEDEQAVAKDELETPTYSKVVDKLNLLRSGKSTRDKEVASQVKKYFNSLSGPERVALYAYLTGLSEIMSGGEEAKKVEDPSEKPYNVDTKRRSTAATEPEQKGEKKPSPGVSAAKSAKIVVGQ